MRKFTAAIVATVALLGMGATPADARPATRTITVDRECDYEDGSGPRDTHANQGCAFYGSDLGVYVNWDGGRRWAKVKVNKNHDMPNITRRYRMTLTYDVQSGKVITVRHASGRYSAGKVNR